MVVSGLVLPSAEWSDKPAQQIALARIGDRTFRTP
jgi:hypothetical protein